MSTLPSRRRTWMVAGALLLACVVVAVVGSLMLGSRLKSPEQAVADAAPPAASLVTAEAQERVLAETVLLRGKVEPGQAIKVVPPGGLAGDTSVVTGTPVTVGTTLKEGTVVLEVSGNPVFALALTFPLYRDITDGMSGPDVRQVQRALTRLGYRHRETAVFDEPTQNALRRFYSDRRYQVPEHAAADAPTPPPEDPAQTKKPVLARKHVLRLDQPNRVVSAAPVAVGAVLTDPAAAILELDAGSSTVAAIVPVDRAALVTVGTEAEARDEVRNVSASATVQSVGTEPKPGDQGTGFEIRFAFIAKPLEPTPNHTVRITVGVGRQAAAVLAVPVTAVYSRPDGTTFVTVVSQPSGGVVDVTVRTGQSAGGWVEITPLDAEIRVGSSVVVGSTGPVTSR